MAVKAVEMIRKIRDQHYTETKELSVQEQIKFVRKKSLELQKKLKRNNRSTAENTVQTAKS